jgi:hypothetical protein
MAVTKSSLIRMIETADEARLAHIIGRACVALFRYQTTHEQAVQDTNVDNGEGFTSADARGGSLTALYYLKHGNLLQWQIDRWTKVDKRGTPRIAKYWKQLDRAAAEKAALKVVA